MKTRYIAGAIIVLIAAIGLCEAARGATNPTPLVSLPLVPTAVAPGGAGFTLTVNGTGFVAGAVVNWNGSPRATTFVSGSQVTAAITPVDIATAGGNTITVTNPGPGGGTSSPVYFAVTNPTPTVAFQDSVVPGITNASQVLVGDFNGDGKPDLIVLESVIDNNLDSVFEIEILLGNGDGTFQPPTVVVQVPKDRLVTGLAVGDFNGDGKLDVVGSFSFNGNGIFTLLGNGDGTFQLLESDFSAPPSTFSNEAATLVADVNGDGVPDLVRACGAVCIDLGNGDGTFRRGSSPLSPTGEFIPAGAVAIGDFRKSGKLDIVTAANHFELLPGNGDGTFGPASVVFEGPPAGLQSLATADFDGDGNLDLAFFSFDPNGPAVFPDPNAISTMRGNGDGTFQLPRSLGGFPESLNAFTEQSNVVIPGDFNGDGHIDVAISNAVVLIKSLTAADANYSVVQIPPSYTIMAAGDFRGRGRLDLLAIDFIGQEHLLSQIDPGDFQGEVEENTTRRVEPGGKARYRIKISAINGFTGTVSFNVGGLPEGASATFDPNTLSGAGETTLTIHTSHSTPKGSYPLVLSGISGNLTHSGPITLNVGPHDEFTDFTGSVQPSFENTTPGASTTFNITAIPLNGFHGDVNLSVSGLPAGGRASFSPSEIEHGSGASVLTITTAPGTATGTYPLTITGTSEGQKNTHTHSTVVNLNVGPTGTDFTDFTASVTPAAQTVAAGSSAIFTISTQAVDGPSVVSVQVDGNVPPGIMHFYPGGSVPNGTGSTALGFQTSPQTPPGTYVVRIVLFNARVVHEVDVTLIVTQ